MPHYRLMQEDRILEGKRYRVLVEPFGVTRRRGLKLLVYVDDNPRPIHKRLASIDDTEQDLMREGLDFAAQHANDLDRSQP